MVFKDLCLLFLLCCGATLGAPAPEPTNMTETLTFLKRNTRANPIDATFDITNWQNIAEIDCFAMLCIQGGNRVYQKVPNDTVGDANYRNSGAALQPFTPPHLSTRHTDQINANTVSAEEFPWKSTQEGGPNANVFPATVREQNVQGGIIGRAYNRHRVGPNDFFRITFVPPSLFGQYCTALFANPPDMSVCGKQPKQTFWGITGVDIANYAYKLIKFGITPYVFEHAAGINKGKVTKRHQDFDVSGILETAEDVKAE